MTDYPDIQLYINGHWREGAGARQLPVHNPATGKVLGQVACAETADLAEAADAAERGFARWRITSAFERYKILRKAAQLLRERLEHVARLMTQEQGKPLAEARMEILAAADTIDWFAEEGRRAYGRVIPPRQQDVYQLVIQEPVGPVAAFTPWNFPINQIVRKLSAALAAGCSIIVKAPEETPASPAELIRVFIDAGVPDGVVNLVYGDPAHISSFLIAHPVIRKISFTGSTPVGKQLAALAGEHMKRMTMELGGHAPVIIFNDADVALAAKTMLAGKFRNAGQVCVSPTRFLVQEGVYQAFVEQFVAQARSLQLGNGLDAATTMGPLANPRRLSAMNSLTADAQTHHAKLQLGGKALDGAGHFFAPTVLTEVPPEARLMNEEPFGPIALINPFATFDDAVREANRLPVGLAAYAWTRSARTAQQIGGAVQAGMVSINHLGLGMPETPFGGVKDSGYGSEGGTEALQAYLNPKFISQAGLL
ncbi:NAD-dependent succinate-semialdehyde dehydrogenase [Limnohabitans sp.]|jgi:succinate-semialdehyde dehydrogenase/glutarate-semialdehyde dehydrogenase|uniref:NAD-dependent succinate-semialdehyde dehydrogenase n=1 Tax=Limnohabitans sp. TaxID=1907725 RepID=UPI002FDD879B